MALAALILVTLACSAWSLWIRRVTWRCKWELAATLNIALQGAAVFLMSPLASATIGHWLYKLTGQWNLEDYIGHDCYVVAATAVAFNVFGRLDDTSVTRRTFKLHVEIPATLCIPLMLATFSLSPNAYRADFFRLPTDGWLALYWTLLCSTLLWLLIYSSRATLILRKDPRSSTVATIYLLSAISGMIACMVRVGTTLLPPWVQDTSWVSFAVWVPACLCGAGFALTSAYSWRAKLRWFTRRQLDLLDK